MINMQSQDVIDLNDIEVDPVTCVACINWNEIPISSAKDDMEQGRLLEAKTFEDIIWYEYPGSLTGMISKILNALPQNKEYRYVTQGFSDALVGDIMKIVRIRDTRNHLN
ncbi:hypothetical protein MNBD_GAMMA09-2663 [hydrothermal vent metagenome]|uniref:Uncharacterized protein n=1 Tax=hydrothermal vent metagenome TaxID=652676 RepID=A0A3B0XZQ2_9ZZZZ